MTPSTVIHTLRSATVVVGLTLAVTSLAAAQSGDARWHPWVGCWAPQKTTMLGGLTPPQLCFVPSGWATVEIITVSDGNVIERTTLDAGGGRTVAAKDGCNGWEQAQFAKDGARVFVRSELDCGNGLTRKTSAVIAIADRSAMLQVQGLSSGTYSGVHAARYTSVAPPAGLPEAALAALQTNRAGVETSRLIVSRALTNANVIEAVQAVDASVVETFLTERRQSYDLDDKALLALADAKVPGDVVDLMVALTYPKVFAVNPATGAADFQPEATPVRGTHSTNARDLRAILAWQAFYPLSFSPWDAWSYRNGFAYSPSSYYGYRNYGNGFGYGNGYNSGGWYPGTQPVVIVRAGDSGEVGGGPKHGRVVNGVGYTQGSRTSGSGTPRSSASSGGSSGGSSSSSAGSSSSSGSSSGSGSASAPRTAQPRTPDKTP